MIDKDQDPNLQAPQEANTTKHINFLDTDADPTPGSGDDTGDESPTKKAWEELRRDEAKNNSNEEGSHQ